MTSPGAPATPPELELAIAAAFPDIDVSRLPGYTRITVATLISSDPVLFFGALVSDPTSSHGIAVYDGQDNISGRLFGSILVSANVTSLCLLPHPLLFRQGLFIDIVTSLNEATLLWRPALPEELAGLL